eukprot:m.3591 g.3591  ORF g.3591 m.3591 type:complete len:236 (-) comp3641_c0_seq1:83-790(-)
MRELWYRTDPRVIAVVKGNFEPIGMHVVCLPSGEGVVVVDIAPGTAADICGELKRGMVLTAVNSIPLRFTSKAKAAETIQFCGNELEFTVGGYVKEVMLKEILFINEQAENADEQSDWVYVVKCSLKFPFLLPVMLLLFTVSIVEGFGRMLTFRILALFRIVSQTPDTKNLFFDLTMVVWYFLVLDRELNYVDPMKRLSKDVKVNKEDMEVHRLRPSLQFDMDRPQYKNATTSEV